MFGPHDLKPKRGWREDRTPWWCDSARPADPAFPMHAWDYLRLK